MAIRVTGLNSGLDTDSIVQELVSAYRTKGEKYEKAQTKISWKQEAWKSLSSKTYSFRTGLDKMRFSSGYNLKTTTVSNSSKAKITTSNNAVNGTQTLEIKQLAKTGYLTGGKVKTEYGTYVEASATMANLGVDGGEIAVNGKRISLSASMSINDVVSKLNDAGVNASYDETNRRFFISSTESGASADFSITGLDEAGIKTLTALGLNTDSAVAYTTYATNYSGKTDKELAEILQSMSEGTSSDIRLAIFSKEYQAATDEPTKQELINEFKNLISYGESIAKENRYKAYAESYGKLLDSNATTEPEKTNEVTENLKNALLKFQSKTQNGEKVDEREIETLAKRYQDAEAINDSTEKDNILREFSQLLSDAKKTAETESVYKNNTDAVRINGQDAKIILNGAEFTSTKNSFNINGLAIETLATTEAGEVLSITTSTDSQGIYDKVKDFFSEYNELINAMTKSYNAESTSTYEPLTDDEKDAMSESEIEKWEEKGKSGILRRDSTLSTLMSVLNNTMAKSYTINGKKYALSSFGIKTLGIMNAETNEHNAYHIDGDADDESTSSNTDQLMAAIVEDPESVMEFFKQLANDLYDTLGKQMTSTTLRSYGSFYNDKELETQYKSYTTKISDWETKVEELEERYYKQFSKMESALAELNSQQSSLSGLLG